MGGWGVMEGEVGERKGEKEEKSAVVAVVVGRCERTRRWSSSRRRGANSRLSLLAFLFLSFALRSRLFSFNSPRRHELIDHLSATHEETDAARGMTRKKTGSPILLLLRGRLNFAPRQRPNLVGKKLFSQNRKFAPFPPAPSGHKAPALSLRRLTQRRLLFLSAARATHLHELGQLLLAGPQLVERLALVAAHRHPSQLEHGRRAQADQDGHRHFGWSLFQSGGVDTLLRRRRRSGSANAKERGREREREK